MRARLAPAQVDDLLELVATPATLDALPLTEFMARLTRV
jgi:hypothetical protein